jgi:hypothetical protein
MLCLLDIIFIMLIIVLLVLIYYKIKKIERKNSYDLSSPYPIFKPRSFDNDRDTSIAMETFSLVRQQIKSEEIARLAAANTLPSAGLSLIR